MPISLIILVIGIQDLYMSKYKYTIIYEIFIELTISENVKSSYKLKKEYVT